MERKIDFDFRGHVGAWGARPHECPLKRELCACGTMSFRKEWMVYDKLEDLYEVCPHFVKLGPDVPKEGTNDSYPVVVECKEE